MTTAESKIRIRGLSKAFGDKVVLDGLDLDVCDGESLVVIGGSGTGKSVLLKCILGLIEPDSGSIQVDGVETIGLGNADREAINAKFGMLFQNSALFDSLPVWENVSFGLLARRMTTRPEARRIAVAKLAQVGLTDSVAALYPAELSGGMQKRVALARAIATDPEIIFFDEPTTGLDPIMADVINDLIVKITRETAATALSITHDMVSARKIAHRVAMLYEGRIIWVGRVEELEDCVEPHVDQFIHGRAEGPIRMAVRA
ncbi:MAG: ATP-binding cassette domain-containing protein [Rhodospirillales bacterium]|nr:MAG: ATP-binding cassette domain-containing protein [Rhodospirillales bacterium]